MTVVIETAAVLNSRPLSYISSDVEEPLTPSHLLFGYRILSIPDPLLKDADPDILETTNTVNCKMKHMTKVKGETMEMMET